MLERNICPHCQTKGSLKRNWNKEIIYAVLFTLEDITASAYLTKNTIQELRQSNDTEIAEKTLEEYDLTSKKSNDIPLFTCTDCKEEVTKKELEQI